MITALVAYEAIQDVHLALSGNGIAEAGLFSHTKENQDIAPDLQLIFSPAIWASPGYPNSDIGFAGLIILNHPNNIGSLSLRSSNPHDPPIIQMNFLQDRSDVQKLIEGIELVCELFDASSFDEFRGREVAPGADVTSDEAIGEKPPI
jgi:choline dehydrogenase